MQVPADRTAKRTSATRESESQPTPPQPSRDLHWMKALRSAPAPADRTARRA